MHMNSFARMRTRGAPGLLWKYGMLFAPIPLPISRTCPISVDGYAHSFLKKIRSFAPLLSLLLKQCAHLEHRDRRYVADREQDTGNEQSDRAEERCPVPDRRYESA